MEKRLGADFHLDHFMIGGVPAPDPPESAPRIRIKDDLLLFHRPHDEPNVSQWCSESGLQYTGVRSLWDRLIKLSAQRLAYSAALPMKWAESLANYCKKAVLND